MLSQFPSSIHRGFFAAFVLALSLLAPCWAAPPDAYATPSHPDLSGFWQVDKGQWTVPQTAKLTPAALAVEQRSAREMAAGKVVAYASRWCNPLGVPFLMGQSPPINIVQGSDEIVIMSEQNSVARHIYLDGRPHPAPSTFEPTTDGHSVGHWERDVLVVDTTNFSDNGHVDIPGGGYRTFTSHLVERFSLLDGGRGMKIQSTWEDPNVFTEPHSYASTYRKLPPGSYAFEDSCDASDAAPFTNSGGTRAPHEP
jgi:hypothetical protein